MRLALTSTVPPGTPRPPFYQRTTSLVGAVIVTLLIILAMWDINVRTPEKPRFKGTTLIELNPEADKTDTTKHETKAQPHQQTQAQPTPTPPKAAPPPPRPSPLPVVHPFYIPLTKEENDTADIGRMPHAGPRSAGSPGSPGDAKPIGTAPDGSPLYPAQWYREPTNAELGFYLPKNRSIHGIGLIACKTIDHHHVDDCVELASSPPGSHLANAARQAAWQFLVRAPRLGGKELVGSWVRIEIDYDYTVEGQADRSDELPKQAPNSTYIPY